MNLVTGFSEVIHGISPSLQANSVTVPKSRPWPIPFLVIIPNHLTIRCFKTYAIKNVLLNTP